jgi:hypothetical protein
MIKTYRLMKYLGLTIATVYILSIGSAYALIEGGGGSGGSGGSGKTTNTNITAPLIAQVQKNLMNAKQADDSGNLTLAFREVDQAKWYLDRLMEIYQFLCSKSNVNCFG